MNIPRLFYLLVSFPCFLWLCLLLKEIICFHTEKGYARFHQVQSVEEKKVFLVEKQINVDAKLANFPCKHLFERAMALRVDSTALSIFVLVELTNTVFVNSTNITTKIETVVLSTLEVP